MDVMQKINSSEFAVVSDKLIKLEQRLKELFRATEAEIEFRVDQKLKKVDERMLEVDKRIAIIADKELKNKRIVDFMERQDEKNSKFKVGIRNLEGRLEQDEMRYDNIIRDNLSIPGLLGDFGKFKNLGALLTFLLEEVSKLERMSKKNEIEVRIAQKDVEKGINNIRNINAQAEKKVRSNAKSLVDILRRETEEKLVNSDKKVTRVLELTSKNSVMLESGMGEMERKSMEIKTEILDTLRKEKRRIDLLESTVKKSGFKGSSSAERRGKRGRIPQSSEKKVKTNKNLKFVSRKSVGRVNSENKGQNKSKPKKKKSFSQTTLIKVNTDGTIVPTQKRVKSTESRDSRKVKSRFRKIAARIRKVTKKDQEMRKTVKIGIDATKRAIITKHMNEGSSLLRISSLRGSEGFSMIENAAAIQTSSLKVSEFDDTSKLSSVVRKKAVLNKARTLQNKKHLTKHQIDGRSLNFHFGHHFEDIDSSEKGLILFKDRFQTDKRHSSRSFKEALLDSKLRHIK